jgi:hypothetical protein
MSAPLEPLYNALAEASNALNDTPDICEDMEEAKLREQIDTKIDEVLNLVRTWREMGES